MKCITIYLFILSISLVTCKYRRVCYHTNWSQYRNGPGRFIPQYIDPSLCTHLIYAFGKLQNNRIIKQEHNDIENFKIFNDLKYGYPDLKTLIAIGGWNAASAEFTRMVESSRNRQVFISSTISFLREHNFDGLDLDWEYPGQIKRGGRPQDKRNFVLLVKELKEAFNSETRDVNKRLLLTAAVAAGKSNIDPGYDVPELSKYLDFISLMTYDLHGSWETKTGHNSPLFPRSSETGTERQLNTKWAAEYWVSLGAPKSLLNIGLATYGRSFTLRTSSTGMGAPTGPPRAGRYTGEAGFLSYYEICLQQSSGQGTIHRDTEHKVPYYVNDDLWVGYDDVQSVETKAHWIISEGYGGGMVWSLDLDDFNQICSSSNTKYPLLTKMAEILLKAENRTLPTQSPTRAPRTTSKPTSVTKTKHQTEKPGYTHKPKDPESSCSNKPNGYYPKAGDCTKFMLCQNQVMYDYTCPGDLWWNQEEKVCDYKHKTICYGLMDPDFQLLKSVTQGNQVTEKKTDSYKTHVSSPTVHDNRNKGNNLKIEIYFYVTVAIATISKISLGL